MANPAIVADIEARWRSLSDQETINAEAYLADAWALLLSRRPTLEADITAETISTANAVRVVSAMVLRVLKNPEGKQSESIDDYRYTRAELMGSGLLHVTADELADLTVTTSRGTRSIRLVAYGEH